MTQRPGVSLAEVLIAMFVLTIGLLGVLSLFPLGAVRMAQAIKDDRCATVNNDVAANMRWVWEDLVNQIVVPPATQRTLYPGGPTGNGVASPNLDRYDPFFNARVNPNFAWNPDLGAAGQVTVQSTTIPVMSNLITGIRTGPSYPVFVDPIGWNNNVNATNQFWVGGNTSCIPRRSLRSIEFQPFVQGQGYTQQWSSAAAPLNQLAITLRERYFVHQDDLGFGLDGSPYDSKGVYTAGSWYASTNSPAGLTNMVGQVQRDGRYNSALLIQWQDKSNFQITSASASIVVYSGRSLDVPSAETVYTNAIFQIGRTTAFIFYNTAGPQPNLRKGSWILDGTMFQPSGTQNLAGPHGYFYRIVNIANNDTTNGVLTIELQTPAQASTILPSGQGYGLAVAMDNVVEVFQGRALTYNARPVP
jgi:hypothetical protein